MYFIKRYWKQIFFSILGGGLFLTSLALASGGLMSSHLFSDKPYTFLEWIVIILVLVEVFPLLFMPNPDILVLAILLWLFKGWALGFGVCQLFRKSLRFESNIRAFFWWYCFGSLLGCALLSLISLTCLLDLNQPDTRGRVAYFCGMSFLYSSALLIPVVIVSGSLSFLRWVHARKLGVYLSSHERIE